MLSRGAAIRQAALRKAQGKVLGTRLARRGEAKSDYIDWLDRGGIRSAAPLPKKVKAYVQQNGPDSLDDLRP